MYLCMCLYMCLCKFVNINRQDVQPIQIHLPGVSMSIYFCVDPDVTAKIWIAYNWVSCVNKIRFSKNGSLAESAIL